MRERVFLQKEGLTQLGLPVTHFEQLLRNTLDGARNVYASTFFHSGSPDMREDLKKGTHSGTSLDPKLLSCNRETKAVTILRTLPPCMNVLVSHKLRVTSGVFPF